MEGLLIVVILLLELLTRRLFCRSFCPLGGMLALLGRHRRLRIHLDTDGCTSCGACTRACPAVRTTCYQLVTGLKQLRYRSVAGSFGNSLFSADIA